jgi:hypothetical protein
MAISSEVIVVAVRDNSILVHNRNPLYVLIWLCETSEKSREEKNMKATIC